MENGLGLLVGMESDREENWGLFIYRKDLEGQVCVKLFSDLLSPNLQRTRFDHQGKLLDIFGLVQLQPK
jgi:hypothetical protein